MSARLAPPDLRILGPRALLLGPGDGDSLQNVDTSILPDGAVCFVLQTRAPWRFDRLSTLPPDGTTIIAPASGPGRWLLEISPPSSGIQIQNLVGTVLPFRALIQTEGLHPVDTGAAIELRDGEIDALAYPSLSAAAAANPGRTIRLINATHTLDASITDDSITFRMLEGAVLQIGGGKTFAPRLNCTSGGSVVITSGTPVVTSEIVAHPQQKIFDVTAASFSYQGTFDIYVNWWGVGQPDDGATCLAAVLSLDRNGTLPRPRRVAFAGDLRIVTPFYLTKFRGSGVIFDFTGSHLTVVDPTHSTVGVDFADSVDITTLNLWVTGDTTDYPRVGTLWSRNNNEEPVAGTPRVAGRHVHINPRIDGSWALSALYNCGSEVNRIVGGVFSNDLSTASYGGFFGRVNLDSVVSNDPTVAAGNGTGVTPTTASGQELYGTRFFCLNGNVTALYLYGFNEFSSFETFNVSTYRQLVLDSREYGMVAVRFHDLYAHGGTTNPTTGVEVIGSNLHNIQDLEINAKTINTTVGGTQFKVTFDAVHGAGLSGITHGKFRTEASGAIVFDPTTLFQQGIIDTRGRIDVSITLSTSGQCTSSTIYMGSRAQLTPASSMDNTVVVFDSPGGGSEGSRRLHFSDAGPTLVDQNVASPPTGLYPGEGRIWNGRTGALANGNFPLLRWQSADLAGTIKDNGVQLRDRLYVDEATASVAGDFLLSAGWGDTATVSNVRAGSNDTRGRISITVGGTGIANNPTVTYSFKDGVYPTAPFPTFTRQDNGTPTTGRWVLNAISDSGWVAQFVGGTPVAGQIIELSWLVCD